MDYKLIYFNIRARGEPIRWLFHFTGMEFLDERIDFPDWSELKDQMPMGRLPILEFDEGKQQLHQSMTIGRYLARQFGLCGPSDFSAAQCDQLTDTLQELITLWVTSLKDNDEEKKEELRNDLIQVHFPKYFAHFEKIIDQTEGKFLVDENVTWADIFVACWMENFLNVDENGLDNFPNLQALIEEVRNMAGIKDWIDSRPNSNI